MIRGATMRRRALLQILALLAALLLFPVPGGAGGARFYPIDVVIDSGDVPLAAWQIEVSYPADDLTLVGIEGGEAPFDAPPYYDPKGLDAGRVIIAAFTVGGLSKAGPFRVATIHVMDKGAGPSRVEVNLVLAADRDGNRIDAQARITPKDDETR